MQMRNAHMKQRGIGLLELMLAMVIIAIVTLMSIQYFGTSKRNTMTSKAIDEIQAIVSTVAGMPHPVHTQVQLTEDVALSGKIPSAYVYNDGTNNVIATPWQNSASKKMDSEFKVEIAASTAGGTLGTQNVLIITSTGLPNWGCQSIVDKYKAAAYYAVCANDQIHLEFPLQMTESM